MLKMKETNNEPVPFLEGSKWGYKNKDNKVVIPAKYEKANPFSEGLARVKEDGNYGFRRLSCGFFKPPHCVCSSP